MKKESEIHNGLPLKEVRDFLSESLRKNIEYEYSKNSENFTYRSDDPIKTAIHSLENDIERLKMRVHLLKEREAIITIMSMNGWNEYDVSDHTRIENGNKFHLPFVGTEEEYNNLMKEIYPDEFNKLK